MITISVPLSVVLGKKRYYLSLNNYRNWHFIVSNKLKELFTEQVFWENKDLFLNPVSEIKSMEYQLFFPDSRRRDKMNFISVIDKFFLDVLVKKNFIVDDNDDFVGETVIKKPLIDKKNPRCEITIF